MDSRAFLGLRRSHNPYRWSLEVTPGLATAGQSCILRLWKDQADPDPTTDPVPTKETP